MSRSEPVEHNSLTGLKRNFCIKGSEGVVYAVIRGAHNSLTVICIGDEGPGILCIGGVGLGVIGNDKVIVLVDSARDGLGGLHLDVRLNSGRELHYGLKKSLVIVGRLKILKEVSPISCTEDRARFHNGDHTVAVDNNGTGSNGKAASIVKSCVILYHGEGISVLLLEILYVKVVIVSIVVDCDDLNVVGIEIVSVLNVGELL